MAGVKKGGLGKGLGKGIGIDSLIPPEKAKSKDAVMIDIQKVEPNREQPRKNFDEDSCWNYPTQLNNLEFYSLF